MDDRTLLEMAAKAAGLTVLTWNTKIPALLLVGPVAWNPLTDDGDALRLASQVGLRINFAYKTGEDERSGVAVWTPGDFAHYPPFWTSNSRDHCADVRGTIVRAAAAIGEQML